MILISLQLLPETFLEIPLPVVLSVALPSVRHVHIILGKLEHQKENWNSSQPGSSKHLLRKLKE